MALASGRGCVVEEIGDAFTAFGEDQARYVVTSATADRIQVAGIPMTRIGTVGGTAVTGPGFDVALTQLRAAHDSFFKDWMES
jgi:phosphoribosylformylglycinamidine synthase